MRRKRKFQKVIPPDPLYNNVLVQKFINYVMGEGKKSKARTIVYGAFDIIKEKTKTENPLEVFDSAIRNSSPVLEVKSKRIGGATYQVPREVAKNRRIALAMRWIIEAANNQKGKPMKEKLAQEIIASSKNEGSAVKKRENIHRMAEANRAFAHFAR